MECGLIHITLVSHLDDVSSSITRSLFPICRLSNALSLEHALLILIFFFLFLGDTGTLKNQTYANGTGPAEALRATAAFSGEYDHRLSFLPGQRTSACTCSSSSSEHPGVSCRISRSQLVVTRFGLISTYGGRLSRSQLQSLYYELFFSNSQTSTLEDRLLSSMFWKVSIVFRSTSAIVLEKSYKLTFVISSVSYLLVQQLKYTTVKVKPVNLYRSLLSTQTTLMETLRLLRLSTILPTLCGILTLEELIKKQSVL